MKSCMGSLSTLAVFSILSPNIEAITVPEPPQTGYHSESMREKCHAVSKEMYEFSTQLTDSNRKMFCTEFSDEERKKAMQMANQKNIFGGPSMTPDQAVKEIASERKK